MLSELTINAKHFISPNLRVCGKNVSLGQLWLNQKDTNLNVSHLPQLHATLYVYDQLYFHKRILSLDAFALEKFMTSHYPFLKYISESPWVLAPLSLSTHAVHIILYGTLFLSCNSTKRIRLCKKYYGLRKKESDPRGSVNSKCCLWLKKDQLEEWRKDKQK